MPECRNNMTWKKLSLIFILASGSPCFSQDLLSEIETSDDQKDPVIGTFKGTRLINFHTVETLKRGALDFRISHRFGDLSSGIKNLYGLDGPATLRLGFDYSVTDRLVLGFGRTSLSKMVDAFGKYKITTQAANGSALSVVLVESINVTTGQDPAKAITGIDRYQHFYSRLAYLSQVLVARKFSSAFSLQVMPTWLHYNLVTQFTDKNDVFALPLAGRYKITKRTAITAEYAPRVSFYSASQSSYHNIISIGFDIETGGHVFQLFFSNAAGINETQLIPFTTSSWSRKEVRFGFNISRVFQLTSGK